MKIIRSKGLSYTELETQGDGGDNRSLSRGLTLHQNKAGEAVAAGIEGRSVRPDQLPDYLKKDPELFLRQLVAVLDRLVRKPKRLRSFSVDAYVRRTELSKELWAEFENKILEKTEDLVNRNLLRMSLKPRWEAKVHPYRQEDVYWNNPRGDDNAEIIRGVEKKREAKEKPRAGEDRSGSSDHKNDWGKGLWQYQEGSSEVDFAGTAKAVFDHLLNQEIQIEGRPRQKRGHDNPPTGIGLIQERGTGIQRSVHDPRELDEVKRKKRVRKETWCEAETGFYFKPDVARKIVEEFLVREDKFHAGKHFGRMLFEHFGSLGFAPRPENLQQEQLWALHNAVRQYYKRIAKTDRFKRAVRDQDTDRLRQILPPDKERLLSRLGKKKQNADFSRLIRLGKMVAHAADLPEETSADDADSVFKQRLDYFATSAGQSEIKRNESFVRIWRTSVAFSLRTLRPWADPEQAVQQGGGDGPVDRDLAGKALSELAVDQLDESCFNDHAPLIFGQDKFQFLSIKEDGSLGESASPVSRTELLFNGDREHKQEMLWAFLRLAAEVRDRTVHFNTKRRLMRAFKEEILTAPEDPYAHYTDMKKGQAHKDALARLRKLLSFDLQVEAQILADDLNRLDFGKYVPKEKLTDTLTVLSEGRDAEKAVTPKFMSLLRRAKWLAEDEGVKAPEVIAPFAGLTLDNLSKEMSGPNHFRVGVLRLLYDGAFAAWLYEHKDETGFMDKLVEEVRSSKNERREAYNKANKKIDSDEPTRAEELLGRAKTLDELLVALAHEAMQEPDRPDDLTYDYEEDKPENPYIPDRQAQRDQSERLEKFKREVIVFCFGRFLSEKKLSWIWVAEELAADAPEPEKLSASSFSIGHRKWSDAQRLFYAWLYLVPVDQVSMLRHQFKKTTVLERKGAGETDGDNLAAFDRLMGLYARVQTAGFDGQEQEQRLNSGKLFYAGDDLFQQVFSGKGLGSEEADELLRGFPGTRRGLRQLVRFDTLRVLVRIFKAHQVTEEEVKKFGLLSSGEIKDLFKRKTDQHTEIVEKAKEFKANQESLKTLCAAYRDDSIDAAYYNFAIGAARLTEFADIHHLLMRILARLLDFTAMWERDHLFLVLGMLWKKYPASTLYMSEAGHICLEPKAKERDESQRLELIDAKRGMLKVAESAQSRLDADDIALVEKYFGTLSEENEEDVRSRNRHNKNLREGQVPMPNGVGYLYPKKQIRNDFAHFNVLDWQIPRKGPHPGQEKRHDINLTYLVNAVRSLLNYDRKLKNAVSKAITDILYDEGIDIAWEMNRDRLRNAKLAPRTIPHLDFGPLRKEDWGRFDLPRVSMRYMSMVKALFDFGASGNAKEDEDNPNVRRLQYPESLPNRVAEAKAKNDIPKIPDEILSKYQILPQKQSKQLK